MYTGGAGVDVPTPPGPPRPRFAAILVTPPYETATRNAQNRNQKGIKPKPETGNQEVSNFIPKPETRNPKHGPPKARDATILVCP